MRDAYLNAVQAANRRPAIDHAARLAAALDALTRVAPCCDCCAAALSNAHAALSDYRRACDPLADVRDHIRRNPDAYDPV